MRPQMRRGQNSSKASMGEPYGAGEPSPRIRRGHEVSSIARPRRSARFPAACSGGSGSGGAASPSPQASNLIAFPLFDSSSVLAAHSFSQTVSAQPKAALNDMLGQGAGTYNGHEVVAGTLAVMPALETWLHDLDRPPARRVYVAASGNGVDAIRARTRDMGLDFAVFQNTVDGKTPRRHRACRGSEALDQKAGPVLGMIGKFKLLPQIAARPDRRASQETDGIYRHRAHAARTRRSARRSIRSTNCGRSAATASFSSTPPNNSALTDPTFTGSEKSDRGCCSTRSGSR